jgi:hypothetical protein
MVTSSREVAEKKKHHPQCSQDTQLGCVSRELLEWGKKSNWFHNRRGEEKNGSYIIYHIYAYIYIIISYIHISYIYIYRIYGANALPNIAEKRKHFSVRKTPTSRTDLEWLDGRVGNRMASQWRWNPKARTRWCSLEQCEWNNSQPIHGKSWFLERDSPDSWMIVIPNLWSWLVVFRHPSEKYEFVSWEYCS